MQVNELIGILQRQYNQDDHIAVHIWSPEDVFQVAEEIGATISKNEAEEIIDDINRHIDSEYGVSWTTVRCVLEDYLRDKKENG